MTRIGSEWERVPCSSMPAEDMPRAEVLIDSGLLRSLLRDQHPDLADLPHGAPVGGWDNVNIPVGRDLMARLPRRAMSAPLIENEQRWLPQLAPTLPLPIPVPVRVGRPGHGYPWSWSICRRLSGDNAATTPPILAAEAAATLGRFLRALHVPAPADAPVNPYRGVPLGGRFEVLRGRIEQLADEIDAAAVLAVWTALVETPTWAGPPLWLHGDLHPGNVIVHGGEISGIVDFGDITAGDPATDLAIAWMMLPAPVRPLFRAAAGDVDDHTWTRARGWALAYSLTFIASSADNQAMNQVGRYTLDAVLDDRN